jgi:hypothetical protein
VLTGTWTTTTYTDFPVFRVFTKSGTSYLVVVNGTGATPKKWDGSAGSISDVGGSPGGARAMAILANRMILGTLLPPPPRSRSATLTISSPAGHPSRSPTCLTHPATS